MTVDETLDALDTEFSVGQHTTILWAVIKIQELRELLTSNGFHEDTATGKWSKKL